MFKMSKVVILLPVFLGYLQLQSSYKVEKSSIHDFYGSSRRVGRQPHPVSQWNTSMPVGVLVEKRGASPSGKRTFSKSSDSTAMSNCLCNPAFLAQYNKKYE